MLRNKIVSLRALEPTDLTKLYEWENNPEIWDVGNTNNPLSKATLRTYIENAHNNIYQDLQIRLMIEDSNHQTIGCADLYDFEPRSLKAGISLLIDKNFRNKGYAYQAMLLLEKYAFEFLHIHQLYAFIPVSNSSSRHIFEKLGYTQSAVLKDWVRRGKDYEDVCVFQRIN